MRTMCVLVMALLPSVASAQFTRVDVATDGTTPANSTSRMAALSGDERFVAFLSEATNLVAGDTTPGEHAFVRDLQTGITARVDRPAPGLLEPSAR